ncbi:MAG: transcription termination/antitermination protein NusA, partial [Alteromonadaceae bacterium]|nr:transcription termination/antitermination protein NusA [Alteromonadaceae bacterium]
MSKEILMVVDAISNEKGVPRDVIFEAVEAALASASRKRFDREEASVRVRIDRSTGEYDTFRFWTVVEDDEFETPDYEIKQTIAEQRDPPLALGDVVEHQIENAEFVRIAAPTAKQVIV